jgi:hypothetical protein
MTTQSVGVYIKIVSVWSLEYIVVIYGSNLSVFSQFNLSLSICVYVEFVDTFNIF